MNETKSELPITTEIPSVFEETALSPPIIKKLDPEVFKTELENDFRFEKVLLYKELAVLLFLLFFVYFRKWILAF